MRLTLISYLDVLNDDFEAIPFRVTPSAAHVFRRCQHPAQLADCVAVSAPAHGSIRRLDLYGHGAPGSFTLGSSSLVHWERPDLFERFVPLLKWFAPAAELRLLGCNVGVGLAGRSLVDGLARFLEAQPRSPGLVVLASAAYLDSRDFGSDGFLKERDHLCISSARPGPPIESIDRRRAVAPPPFSAPPNG